MKVTSEALIDAPPEDVFSFVSDPARRPEFIPSLAENRNAYPEDRCVGQSWDSEFSLDGVPLTVVGWCTIFEPSERYGVRTKGTIASDWLYTITPEAAGSRVRIEIDCAPQSGEANGTLLAGAICEGADEAVQALKALLEG